MSESTKQHSAPAQPASHRPAWQTGRFWLQWGLTGLIIALIAWRIHPSEVWTVVKDLQPGWLILGVFFLIASNFVHSVKWQKLLECVGQTRVRDLFAVFWSSMATNNVIPFRAGDFLRVQVLSQRTGLARSGIVASLVTERILDGLSFVLILVTGIALLSGGGQELYIIGGGLGFLVIVAMSATIALARMQNTNELSEHRVLRRIPGRLRRPLEAVLPDFIEGLRPLGGLRSGAVVAAWALSAWVLEVLAYVAFGYAFRLDVPFGTYLLVMVAVNFSASITLLPSNLGIYEFAAISILRATGASAGESAAYAIGTHLLVIGTISGVGLLTLAYLRIGPSDVFYVRRKDGKRTVVAAPGPTPTPPRERKLRSVPHHVRLHRQGRR